MSENIQQEVFQSIRNKLPAGAVIAEEIAGLLDISTDSAYRRIRGEKLLSISELETLCRHFRISMDQVLNLENDSFQFQGRFLNPETFRFEEYLQNVLKAVQSMANLPGMHFYYLCKDIPLFHHFQFYEIASFKYHFWMQTILQMPEFKKKKINLEDFPVEYFQLGRKSLDIYNTYHGYELWNLESLNSTIRQIDFYVESQRFVSGEHAFRVYESMEKLIGHLENQAELGYKFKFEDPAKNPLGKFQVYFNEVLLLDNSMLAVLPQAKIAYLVHSGMNFMITRDHRFTENLHHYIQNLIKSSTLLSEVNEKERLRFFKRLKEKLANRKRQLE